MRPAAALLWRRQGPAARSLVVGLQPLAKQAAVGAARWSRSGFASQRLARRQAVLGKRREVGTAAAKDEAAAPEPEPWHVFTPTGLAFVNTAGNLFGFAAAAAHDHLQVRALAGTAALFVLAFNVLMPKPLKTHQRTAAGFGFLFAGLHFANLAMLLHEQSHRVSLSDEEEDIYERGFISSGVTPRQFQKLLKAGAEVRDFGPSEVIAEEGKPVDRLFYVVGGSCETMRGEQRQVIMQYPENVFLGELRPRRWRAEFLGCGQSLAAIAEQEQEEEEDLEEAWLEEAGARRLQRSRSQQQDRRKMLSSGLQDRIGSTTKICAGSAWTSTMAAGPQGCRMLTWPLGSFACVVGAEEKLCEAMEKVDEMSTMAKICFGGAQERYLEGYRELLAGALCDGRVDPMEQRALDRYRVRHSVPNHAHAALLREFGWTEEEYNRGILRSKWRSILLNCRSKPA